MDLGLIEKTITVQRMVSVMGVLYPSVAEAAKVTGIPRTTLSNRIRSVHCTDHFFVAQKCKVKRMFPNNEGRELSEKGRRNLRIAAFQREERIRRKVSVEGTVFLNLRRAALATDISVRTIARYAEDPSKPEYFFVDDVRPQS